jgi:uncharacterized protein (DUF1697 family)
MPTYIALLRGINVGGQKLIKMAELRRHFASYGATSVRTYIQSGNVVFKHREKSSAVLRKKLELHLAAKLGYAVPTPVKTATEFAAIAKGNPYDANLPEFGGRMYVCFFENTPTAAAIREIQPLITDAERLVIKGAAGYAYYADGLGRAKLSSNVIERKLGRATLRNWNTVTALLEMAGLRSQTAK